VKMPDTGLAGDAAGEYREQGFSRRRVGFGRKPAVLVVDAQEAFIGTGTLACGDAGLRAQEAIGNLLKAARNAGVPVLYTRNIDPPEGFGDGPWKLKRRPGSDMADGSPGGEIVESLHPRDGDAVLVKSKPSAFFATPLDSLLCGAGVDTLVVCGATTSGCVRATVVDAFSRDYRVVVPRECVTDRVGQSHEASLADIDAKYGDVLGLKEVLSNIRGY